MAVNSSSRVGHNTMALESTFIEVTNISQSSVTIKRLIAIAISKITYLRSICPEYAYADKKLEDISLKILRDDTSCQKSRSLVHWIRGSFDALDKKYLRQIIFGIFTEPNRYDNLTESYTFGFSYKDGSTSFEISRNNVAIGVPEFGDDLRKSALSLIRSLIVLLQSLDPISGEPRLVMKLLYYDEVTPPDYNPPGFRSADSTEFTYVSSIFGIQVGQVATGFHTMKMSVKSAKKQFVDECDSDKGSNLNKEKEKGSSNSDLSDVEPPHKSFFNTPLMSRDLSSMKSGYSNSTESVVKKANFLEPKTVTGSVVGQKSGFTTKQSSPSAKLDIRMAAIKDQNCSTQPEDVDNITETAEDIFEVQCSCGLDDTEGIMIMCDECSYLQHAICYRIKNKKEVPKRHICQQCAKVSGETGTDESLKLLTDSELKTACQWRRAIAICLEVQRFTIQCMASRLKLTRDAVEEIVKKLLEKKCIRKMSGQDYKISSSFIKTNEWMRYFSDDPDNITSFKPLDKRSDSNGKLAKFRSEETGFKINAKNKYLPKAKLVESLKSVSMNEHDILRTSQEGTVRGEIGSQSPGNVTKRGLRTRKRNVLCDKQPNTLNGETSSQSQERKRWKASVITDSRNF